MLDVFETQSARNGGLISSVSLREVGLSTDAVQSLIDRGDLVRLRRGVYVLGPSWRAARSDERYRLFVLASAFVAQRPLLLSHQSAAALHGLPMIGAWPRTVHAINNDATGGSTARHTTTHRNVVLPDTVQLHGCRVTGLARTLIDVAASSTFLVGVTMIDHALREEQQRAESEKRDGIVGLPPLTRASLRAELEAAHPRHGAQQASRAIDFANPLSANPGESLSRVRIYELGFEVPELQVYFQLNSRSYWVDFYWRRVRKIGEFDGELKYTRGEILGDRDPSDVVIAEKNRENLLRRHSDSFSRWDWDTAYSPQRFCDFLIEHDVPRRQVRQRRAQV